MTPVRIVLFGAPGVGKGTQAALLAAQFGIPHYSTGDILRDAVHRRTKLGEKVKEVIGSGRLVTDAVMIDLVREVLRRPESSAGFILDGFPRTLAQARALSALFEEFDIRDYKVLEIDVDDEELIRRTGNRLVCENEGTVFNVDSDGVTLHSPCPHCGARLVQREDDEEQTVRRRLEIYRRTTSPVLAYYEAFGVVLRIDGSGSVDVVHREINLMLAEER